MSHRSYQPILPCGNKLLQKRWDQTYYDEHRRMVRNAKPMIDTTAPKRHPHVTSKWKKQQIEKERVEEIERDNLMLLSKMQTIMQTEGRIAHKSAYQHHSLNQQQREDEMKRVAEENKAMLHRLQLVQPNYKVTDWIDDWQKKEELSENITTFPSRLPSATKGKSKTLPPGRSISAPYHSRLAKTSATSGKKTKTGVACSGGPGRDSNEGPAGLLKSDVGADDEQQPQSSDTQQAPAAQGEEKGDLVKPKPEE